MGNTNKELRKMRFEQVERMLNSDVSFAEWCRLNKVAKSTMYYWLKIFRDSNGVDSKHKGWIELDRKEIKKAKALAVANVSTPTLGDVALNVTCRNSSTSQMCAQPIKLRINGVEIDVFANTAQAGRKRAVQGDC